MSERNFNIKTLVIEHIEVFWIEAGTVVCIQVGGVTQRISYGTNEEAIARCKEIDESIINLRNRKIS